MFRYITQRLAASIPVLVGILFVTFTLARVLPGDPCRAALGERATDELCDAYIKRFGLDRPIISQFGIYMNDMAHGNFGRSFRYGRPVLDLMIERLPVTLELTLAALTLSSVLGVLAGVLSAYRRNSPIDVGTMLMANVGVSMPVFWLGLMLAYVFALLLKDTPFWLAPSGRNTPGLTIPSLVEAWNVSATQGTGYSILMFLSNLHLFNAFVTGNWAFFWDTHLAGRGVMHDSHVHHCAHDPLQFVGGSGPGLHPHGTGQGLARCRRGLPSRHAQCPAAGCDRHRTLVG